MFLVLFVLFVVNYSSLNSQKLTVLMAVPIFLHSAITSGCCSLLSQSFRLLVIEPFTAIADLNITYDAFGDRS